MWNFRKIRGWDQRSTFHIDLKAFDTATLLRQEALLLGDCGVIVYPEVWYFRLSLARFDTVGRLGILR